MSEYIHIAVAAAAAWKYKKNTTKKKDQKSLSILIYFRQDDKATDSHIDTQVKPKSIIFTCVSHIYLNDKIIISVVLLNKCLNGCVYQLLFFFRCYCMLYIIHHIIFGLSSVLNFLLH